MRAVNLIPADTRRTTLDVKSLRGPAPAVVGLLGVALVLVTMYVLASNSVAQRTTQLANLRAQLAQTKAVTASLDRYTKFEQLAQDRVETVQEITASRFSWAKALSDLSRVIPANTSLSSLSATVSPAATSGGTAGGGGALRGAIDVPAFELIGCTAGQDDVARLMSRLRVMPDVTRVTLYNSAKDSTSAAGSAVATTGGAGGCGASGATFDVVVFFQALPTSLPATMTPASTSSPAGSAAPASTTAPTGTTPPGTPSPAATTVPSSTGGAP